MVFPTWIQRYSQRGARGRWRGPTRPSDRRTSTRPKHHERPRTVHKPLTLSLVRTLTFGSATYLPAHTVGKMDAMGLPMAFGKKAKNHGSSVQAKVDKTKRDDDFVRMPRVAPRKC